MDSPTPHRQLGSPSARQVLLADLHAGLIRADRSALERLAEELLPLLKQRLRKRFPSLAEDLIVDASVDAFLEYAAHPHRLETSVGDLDWVLLYAARRNLMNLLEAERRRRVRETKYFENASHMLSHRVPPSNSADDTWQLILSAAADEREREVIHRWLTEDLTSSALIAALGVMALSLSEQRKEVKRFKDRIIKRLRRRAVKKVNG